ncbi:uncharacterized protein LY79DRAFT_661175 [Colletotrichum navitas]|uniref:Uncharacterized protein n=1 Tax=Colletotrichum navitas TaxID=681940 RepID=A0AAD8V357_9PEZI|nr:uncharacterized protein LY79DRAFT_661175 [Colletotrichum navitas]KAK1580373.1 hypothetical protein LY79DRAFT_661175 [Colletotrichum navitas]
MHPSVDFSHIFLDVTANGRRITGQAIPNYGVTDGSQIDGVVVESDIRHSLIRNHFEKSSMNSKIAVGYSGLSVALSAGANSEAERSLSSEQNMPIKRMIGKYMLVYSTLPVDMGADSKKETTKGNDQSTNRSYEASSDNVVFEAVGGNTILASNPSQGCPTVGDHVNWRVIQRTGLRMIIDSLVDCGDPQFTDAAEVFSTTTQGPVRKCISIPKSSKINVQSRFKTRLTGDDRSHYLYHDICKPIVVQTRRTQRPSELVDGSKFLSVLRTSAGLIVPCITTSEQFLWRTREVLKPHSRSTISDNLSLAPLKHDSLLCLTFDFEDNPRGYRDFQDDDRGFRNDRKVLLLADDDSLKPDSSTSVTNLDDVEIAVGIAQFRIDVRGKP